MTKLNLFKSLQYSPAVLKKHKTRWIIEFYQWHPLKEKKVRLIKTYDINRIKCLKLRKIKADAVIDRINFLLPSGYPFQDLVVASPNISIVKGIELALEIKISNARRATKNSYISTAGIFHRFLLQKNWADLHLANFTKIQALHFLDYCLIERKYSGKTYNNMINKMRSLFNELVDRGHIIDNPFAKMKKKKVQAKKRRAFTTKERKTVIKRAKATNEYLYLAILLQYYCFIRPKEITRLKAHMFDFKNGVIVMPGNITKNGFNGIVTIPDCIVDEVKRIVSRSRPNYYVFGAKLKSNALNKCSKNYLGRLHSGILKSLHREDKLPVLEGLTFYSWKDTGAQVLFKNKINPDEVMKQMRHKDLAYTQRYGSTLHLVNEQIKSFDNAI